MRMNRSILALAGALAALAQVPQTDEVRARRTRTKKRLRSKMSRRGGNNKPTFDKAKANRRRKLARISRRINRRKAARG
jgi:hypothetical protein